MPESMDHNGKELVDIIGSELIKNMVCTQNTLYNKELEFYTE